MKRYLYKLQRVRKPPKGEPEQWPVGTIIWADAPCAGWRVIGRIEV